MRSELLLKPDETAEFLGVKVAPREFGVNIRKLTITDGPGRGAWIDRDDTLRYLDTVNISVGGSAILERVTTELREVLGG